VESLTPQLQEIEERIRTRAFERFLDRGCQAGDEAEDWRLASSDLIAQPAIALSEIDGRFALLFSAPGVDANDLEVLATQNSVLLRSTADPTMKIPGIVHICEFQAKPVFRFVEFPRRIDPRSVEIQSDGGIYRITAAIAGAEASRPQPKAAKASKGKSNTAKMKPVSRLADDLRI